MKRWLTRALAALGVVLTSAPQAATPTEPVTVRMDTSAGVIVLELYPDKAPKTVENFLRYVREGFYDGTIFHRVIPEFMIQGGGFTTAFEQKSTGKPIRNEADNGLTNDRGTIAMARTSQPHSATAQFFINLKDNTQLNHTGRRARGWGYCVFGRVVEGMEVVDQIAQVDTQRRGPHQNVPVENVVIERVSVVEPGQEGS